MTNHKISSQRAFDQQAERYDTTSYSRHAKGLYPVVLAQLSQIPHRQILDVGCGTGELLSEILERWPETLCTGLDLSEKMLAVARNKLGSRAELVYGDAECLPFEAGRFDVVLCNDSFHHYPKPKTVLEEVRRVLQPGGVFLLGDCTAPAGLRVLTNLLLPLGREGDVRLYGPQEVLTLLEGPFHGAECRRVSATSYLAWGIR